MKAKTKKNLIVILNAILGVVFAFTIGFTYAFQSVTLKYGTNPKSTAAYMANQQVEVVNDTILNPIPFGIGDNNHEISVQYSVGYDFDIRLEYSFTWSGGLPANNVILHFADRDKFIVDNNYIYYANYNTETSPATPCGISAGSGKLTVIAGVDFVDTEDQTYFGQTLTINITAKIYKVQTTEDYDAEHPLSVSGSKASTAWLQYKNSSDLGTEASSAYVMVYNYRHNYDQGVSYVGARTSYKRNYIQETNNGTTTTALQSVSRLYGNKAYAGTGVYVITGSNSVKLNVRAEGLWRTNTTEDSILMTNSIQYNYNSDWTSAGYDATNLFETRTFNYYIPAYTTAYIDILDSVEINSIAGFVSNYESLEYDYSRIVTDKIIINSSTFNFDYGVVTTSQQTLDETTTEVGKTGGILCGIISNATVDSATNGYSQKAVDIVNTSLYQNAKFSNSTGIQTAQTYNAGLTFINNTDKYQTVSGSNGLLSFVSNGKTDLLDSITSKRATSYNSSGYYQDIKTVPASTTNYTITMNSTSFVLAPYSSLNFVVTCEVSANLLTWLQDTYTGSELVRTDAWLQLVPSFTASEGTSSTALVVESSSVVSGSNSVITLSIKNSSTNKLTGVNAQISLIENSYKTPTETSSTAPDWLASFWNYFDANDVRAKYGDDFTAGKWRLQSHTYNTIELSSSNVSAKTSFTASVNTSTYVATITNSSEVVLNPNESVTIAVITVPTTTQVIVNATASATSSEAVSSEPALVNAGTSEAYIINYSSTDSYFIRFAGELDAKFSNSKLVKSGDYYYYIDVLRPGQIISLDMVSSSSFKAVKLVSQNWSKDVSVIAGYFA